VRVRIATMTGFVLAKRLFKWERFLNDIKSLEFIGFGGKRRKGKRRIEKCRRKNRKTSKRKMKVVRRAKMHMSKEKI
jgi:hypothetical protein